MRAGILGIVGVLFMAAAIGGMTVALLGTSAGERGIGVMCLIGFGAASVAVLFASADAHSEKTHRPRGR